MSSPTFVNITIKEAIGPLERGEKYREPLDDALEEAGMEETDGGGTMLGPNGEIQWACIDLYLDNITTGIPFLKAKLRELGAPIGSVLEYEIDGNRIEDPVHE